MVVSDAYNHLHIYILKKHTYIYALDASNEMLA
jgi:hypothetical protein